MFNCRPNRKILLFFGSGISFPTKIPNITKLSDKIIDGKWHDHTDESFVKGNHPSKLMEDYNIVPILQGFLKLIQEDADKYLLDHKRPQSNYEDWYYICNQIRDEENHEIYNPTIQNYIEKIQRLLGNVLESMPMRPHVDVDLLFLASRSCGLIQSVLRSELSTNNKPVGLELLTQLNNSKDISRIDIATLNHDTLIETLFHDNNISFLDGFSQSNDGDVRWFLPEVSYQDIGKIKLFKLHGSINWYIYRLIDETTGNGIDRHAIPTNRDHEHCLNARGQDLINLSTEPEFLTGSYNKILEYNFGMIRRIHRYFDFMLDDHNTIIMSGYGWNDRGINGRLFEWIDSLDQNRIVLLHKNPTNIRDNSKSAMWRRFDSLVESGKLILIPLWMSEITIENIDEFIV